MNVINGGTNPKAVLLKLFASFVAKAIIFKGTSRVSDADSRSPRRDKTLVGSFIFHL